MLPTDFFSLLIIFTAVEWGKSLGTLPGRWDMGDWECWGRPKGVRSPFHLLGLAALSLVQPSPPESFAITLFLILLAQAHRVPSLPSLEGPFPPVPSSQGLKNWEAEEPRAGVLGWAREEPRAGVLARPIRAQPSCAPFLGFSPGPPLPLGAP